MFKALGSISSIINPRDGVKNHWVCLLAKTPISWIGKEQGYRSGDIEWPPHYLFPPLHLKPNAVETTCVFGRFLHWDSSLPTPTAPHSL